MDANQQQAAIESRPAGSEIVVYSGGAPREAAKRFAPEFERGTGHRLALTFDGVAPLRERLARGERADVILLPLPMLEALERAGGLRPGTLVPLARTALGVVVREGARVPDVSTAGAFRRALLEARSIAYSDPKLAPSGVHMERVFALLGIADSVRPKARLRTPFDGGVELVAQGEAEMGVYLLSEIRMVEGVTLAGMLPEAFQSAAVYGGAVSADCRSPEPALGLLRFLSDPSREAQWKSAGFEQVS